MALFTIVWIMYDSRKEELQLIKEDIILKKEIDLEEFEKYNESKSKDYKIDSYSTDSCTCGVREGFYDCLKCKNI